MNRAVCLLLGCATLAAIAYDARAQVVQDYLNDTSLSTAHVEVVIVGEDIPQLSWWDKLMSYVGVRSMTRIRPKEGTVLRVVSSAYASSPYQTDSTPCITAAGTTVRPGVVATNFLPFGTIVSINNKKYIVEDRMNTRYNGYYLDIWFPSTSEALEFGRRKLDITIVGYDKPGAQLNPTPAPEVAQKKPKKTVWQSLSELLFTKTYNPNRYDVDCTK